MGVSDGEILVEVTSTGPTEQLKKTTTGSV